MQLPNCTDVENFTYQCSLSTLRFSLLELRLVKSKREGLRKSDMCHSSVTIWRSKQ